MAKKSILFLCTGNSCRSQMGEGWCRYFHNEIYDVYSAGITKHGLNERAVKVMAEAEIDISNHESQTVAELGEVKFDIVITVCSDAHEKCPYFPGGKTIHVGFDDPPRLTKDMVGVKDEEEILDVYRRVRDEIKEKIKDLPNLIDGE
jgi:arsenate reductase